MFADLDTLGWCVIPNALDDALIDAASARLAAALAVRDRIRQHNEVDGSNDGTLHHLLGDDAAFVALLAAYEPFDGAIRDYFGGKYVLNSYGGVVNRQATKAYVHEVHRDIRFAAAGRRFMLNSLVMLDPFTDENGATFVLSGSQYDDECPDRERFVAEAARATGPRGSILFFDSRLWHAAGHNQTTTVRRALTLTFTSPFFKPQLDYVRLLGDDVVRGFNPFLKQVVGYNARVPASLEEFYVPVDRRFYQRGQDH